MVRGLASLRVAAYHLCLLRPSHAGSRFRRAAESWIPRGAGTHVGPVSANFSSGNSAPTGAIVNVRKQRSSTRQREAISQYPCRKSSIRHTSAIALGCAGFCYRHFSRILFLASCRLVAHRRSFFHLRWSVFPSPPDLGSFRTRPERLNRCRCILYPGAAASRHR